MNTDAVVSLAKLSLLSDIKKALRLLHHKALNYSVSLIIVYHFWQVDIKGQRRTFRAFFKFSRDFLEELHG